MDTLVIMDEINKPEINMNIKDEIQMIEKALKEKHSKNKKKKFDKIE